MTSLIVSNVIEYYSLLFSGANILMIKPSYLEYCKEQHLSSDRFIGITILEKSIFKDILELQVSGL